MAAVENSDRRSPISKEKYDLNCELKALIEEMSGYCVLDRYVREIIALDDAFKYVLKERLSLERTDRRKALFLTKLQDYLEQAAQRDDDYESAVGVLALHVKSDLTKRVRDLDSPLCVGASPVFGARPGSAVCMSVSPETAPATQVVAESEYQFRPIEQVNSENSRGN